MMARRTTELVALYMVALMLYSCTTIFSSFRTHRILHLALEDPTQAEAVAPLVVAVDSELSTRNAHEKEQQKSVRAKHHDNHDVVLLDTKDMDLGDLFSAAWLQPISRFLKVDIKHIGNCEGASFAVFNRATKYNVKITLDWFDFAVEHMSRWWKVLRIFDDVIPYNFTLNRFQDYMQKIVIDETDTTMRETIAVIAFMRTRGGTGGRKFKKETGHDDPGRTLTVSSLAATTGSLLQAGFGRVVCVGYNDDDIEFVQDAYRLLSTTVVGVDFAATETTNSTMISKIGPMEVGYVTATAEEVDSTHVRLNMPKAAVQGLQRALNGELDETREEQYLGKRGAAAWKYVFLGEPDLILQTRPSSLPQLRDALDQGLVLAPHRLQIIPHQSDFKELPMDLSRFVPDEPSTEVMDIDPMDGGVCCDENKGPYKPWRDYPKCPTNKWFLCGYDKKGIQNHSRLEQYQWMRLRSGTGVAGLAASNSGRRCFPSMNGTCSLPTTSK